MRKRKKRLKGERVLGLTTFFTDVSREMAFPFLPVFITQVLGAPALILGLIEGWAEVFSSLLALASSRLSKNRKKKPLLVFGYGLSALMKPLFSLASSWPQLFIFRAAEGIGRGIRTPPQNAVIRELERPGARPKLPGLRNLVDSAGLLIGPIIAAAIFLYFGGEAGSPAMPRCCLSP